jgi:hypothetical protein
VFTTGAGIAADPLNRLVRRVGLSGLEPLTSALSGRAVALTWTAATRAQARARPAMAGLVARRRHPVGHPTRAGASDKGAERDLVGIEGKAARQVAVGVDLGEKVVGPSLEHGDRVGAPQHLLDA